jgi:prepilin-type N-terminal cleavage/methylation domain-containing protein
VVNEQNGAMRRDGGFSLIEVLIAFVILAVGLLSLEALGIGAARMVTRAERQGEFATAASDTLEGVMFRLRNGKSFTSPSTYSLQGATMTVTATATPVADGNTMWNMSALVVPTKSRLFTPADSFRISSHVFKPAP